MQPPTYPSASSGYLRWSTGLIAAIALLVCMVSLPRLENYVQSNNEEDAASALRVLGNAGDPGLSTDLATWIAGNSSLRHRFRDARVMEGAGFLMHHGYLFDLHRGEEGELRFVAWPRSSPSTGRAAFLLDVPGRVLHHPNTGGLWSGPGSAPPVLGVAPQDSGWTAWPQR